MASRDPEFVWVVRRRHLFPGRTPHGFLPLSPEELARRYLPPMLEKGFFVERREAEIRPEWKQVIPYCLLRWEGRFLVLERLRKQSEARLHGLLSLGVGGHVNPSDLGGDLLETAAWRELREELCLAGEGAGDLVPLGLLNDDSTEVGAVHVGVVFGLEARGPRPNIREKNKMRGRFTPLVELRGMCQDPPLFESWSAEILAIQGWENRF